MSCLFDFAFGRIYFLFKDRKCTLFTMLSSAIAIAKFVRFGSAILIVLLAIVRGVCFPSLGVPSVVLFSQCTTTSLRVGISVSAARGAAWISSRGPTPAHSILRFTRNGFRGAIHAPTVSSTILGL